MKALTLIGLLLAGLSVSACWDDDQKKKSTEFMSNLTKCETTATSTSRSWAARRMTRRSWAVRRTTHMDPDYGYLNVAVTSMLARITSVGGVIDGALQPVYFITGVLLLVFACIKFLWQRDLAPLAAFVVRYMQLMVLIFVSGQWMPLTDQYVSQMGSLRGERRRIQRPPARACKGDRARPGDRQPHVYRERVMDAADLRIGRRHGCSPAAGWSAASARSCWPSSWRRGSCCSSSCSSSPPWWRWSFWRS